MYLQPCCVTGCVCAGCRGPYAWGFRCRGSAMAPCAGSAQGRTLAAWHLPARCGRRRTSLGAVGSLVGGVRLGNFRHSSYLMDSFSLSIWYQPERIIMHKLLFKLAARPPSPSSMLGCEQFCRCRPLPQDTSLCPKDTSSGWMLSGKAGEVPFGFGSRRSHLTCGGWFSFIFACEWSSFFSHAARICSLRLLLHSFRLSRIFRMGRERVYELFPGLGRSCEW